MYNYLYEDTQRCFTEQRHNLQSEISIRGTVQGDKEPQETLRDTRRQTGAQCYHGVECHQGHDTSTRMAQEDWCGEGTTDHNRECQHRNSDAQLPRKARERH